MRGPRGTHGLRLLLCSRPAEKLREKPQPTLTDPQPKNQQVNSAQQGAMAAVVELEDIYPEVESGEARMQVSAEGESAEVGMQVSA